MKLTARFDFFKVPFFAQFKAENSFRQYKGYFQLFKICVSSQKILRDMIYDRSYDANKWKYFYAVFFITVKTKRFSNLKKAFETLWWFFEKNHESLRISKVFSERFYEDWFTKNVMCLWSFLSKYMASFVSLSTFVKAEEKNPRNIHSKLRFFCVWTYLLNSFKLSRKLLSIFFLLLHRAFLKTSIIM